MINKEELFKEFLKTNTSHPQFIDRVRVVENNLYIVLNNRYEKGLQEFEDEIKSYSIMFGIDKSYECFEITDKLSVFRGFTYSGGTMNFDLH